MGHLHILSQSVKDFLDPWFESEALKVALATDGVIGTKGGPYTPGTAYVLLHHVMGGVGGKRGLWGFVRGGMGGVTQAMAASARSVGVEIRTGARVAKILVRDGRATGVALANGEEIRARVVASNADPKVTFLKLLEERELPADFLAAIRSFKIEGVSMKINLALDGLPDFTCLPGSTLAPHHKTTIHICPTLEYIERAYDDSKYGRPSAQPMLEITIPTTYDSTLAPPGKHVMNIFLQYTPYTLSPEVAPSWHAIKESYADRVMDMIEEYAPGFKSRVLHRHVLSPLDLEEEYGMTGGNIFHGEMSVDQLFFLRPVARLGQVPHADSRALPVRLRRPPRRRRDGRSRPQRRARNPEGLEEAQGWVMKGDGSQTAAPGTSLRDRARVRWEYYLGSVLTKGRLDWSRFRSTMTTIMATMTAVAIASSNPECPPRKCRRLTTKRRP